MQLVLMDIKLPFYNGYHWCSEIRKVSKVPIIFLSSAADNMNIVMAVNMGGDDFVAKPFDLDVLTAKVQALLRRSYDFVLQSVVLEHRGAMLNLTEATLVCSGGKLELTRNELRILQVLMENKKKVVSRDTLMTKLWESDRYVDENTLSVNVNRLRKRLESVGLADFIQTKKGIGYSLTLCAFMTAAVVLVGYRRHWESLCKLEQMRENITVLSNEMKAPEYLYEEQYQDCIRALAQEKDRLRNEMRSRQQNMAAYYSMWVHQIKAPIAALKLLIDEDLENCFELADETQENDTRVRKEQLKQQELFQIEQYADMALQYTCLGTESNDFVFEHVVLDQVIRGSVRKYAKQFIHKKLRLCYEPQEITAVTDRK